MKQKKLTQELVSGIVDAGLDIELKEIQRLAIPKIKSGADLYVIAPEGSGKSTAIILAVIQQLKKAVEEAPRAIIMVENREKAIAMEEQFDIVAKHTDLRCFSVYDQGKFQYEKDMIYEGLDVLIGTPKRLNELMNNTGFPIVKVKMLVVDDAETFFPIRQHTVIYRIADGIEKSQFLIFADHWIDKFDLLTDRIMKNPLHITL
jgi:superfamily II DNA/RNA helicase